MDQDNALNYLDSLIPLRPIRLQLAIRCRYRHISLDLFGKRRRSKVREKFLNLGKEQDKQVGIYVSFPYSNVNTPEFPTGVPRHLCKAKKARKACPKWTRTRIWPVNTKLAKRQSRPSCLVLAVVSRVLFRRSFFCDAQIMFYFGISSFCGHQASWTSLHEGCSACLVQLAGNMPFYKTIFSTACSVHTWLASRLTDWLCSSQIAKAPFSVYKFWWINRPLGFGRTY